MQRRDGEHLDWEAAMDGVKEDVELVALRGGGRRRSEGWVKAGDWQERARSPHNRLHIELLGCRCSGGVILRLFSAPYLD